jgi:murein DD-endopeptidase MepM/ murein hydrolase activator NlpD
MLLISGVAACASTRPPPPPAASTQLAERLSGFIWPLPIAHPPSVTSPYGRRQHRHHNGVDIKGRTGDAIYAASAGRVRFSGWMNGYGYAVIIDHGGGVTTLYAHASALYVSAGDPIDRGQLLAAVGATGNASGSHLHFEIAWAGRAIDPVPLLPRLGP